MRHGVKSDELAESEEVQAINSRIPGSKLGCYFCNDIVAPGNVSYSIDNE